jgi:hypothetical protein
VSLTTGLRLSDLARDPHNPVKRHYFFPQTCYVPPKAKCTTFSITTTRIGKGFGSKSYLRGSDLITATAIPGTINQSDTFWTSRLTNQMPTKPVRGSGIAVVKVKSEPLYCFVIEIIIFIYWNGAYKFEICNELESCIADLDEKRQGEIFKSWQYSLIWVSVYLTLIYFLIFFMYLNYNFIYY